MHGKEKFDYDETKNIQSRFEQQKANEKQEKYREETAAEFLPVYSDVLADTTDAGPFGRMLGYSSLVLAILSIFFMPITLGIASVVLAIPAIRKGADSIGGWALGVSLTVLLYHLTILPFI